ncbi:hypothetical protein BGW80DRAFT_1277902 [Lactifluus volemus]|nr:hypothetical protein BGW80DRAFT_1277902 [Lactifluus volemus]
MGVGSTFMMLRGLACVTLSLVHRCWQPVRDKTVRTDAPTDFIGWQTTIFPSTKDGDLHCDDTCDATVRTIHFSHRTTELTEAYTRVLQGHLARHLRC